MKLSHLSKLIIAILPLLIFFHSRGIVIHDEGYILHSAEKVLDGLIPYRDFQFVYTPLSIYLTALSFNIFGVTVLSSRLLMILISSLSCILIYKTIVLSTRNKFYAVLSVLIFVAWGPSHINFSWPVMFSILASMLVVYLLLKFLETRLSIFLLLAGLGSFAVFLTKQNFGIAILIPVAIFFMIKNSRQLPYILYFLSGYAWGIILYTTYLLATDSFSHFLQSLYLFTFERILLNNRLTTSFIYPDTFPAVAFRTTFYLLPIFLSIGSFMILLIRRRFHLLFIPVFVSVFYLVGIRPTTDYVHLVPLLSLSGIPIALFIRFNVSSNLRMMLLSLSVGLILLGFQTALFKGYYRWDEPLIKHNYYYGGRAGIFVNMKFNNQFSQFFEIINKNTNSNDYILVNSYNPMLYFLTDRAEPIKSGYLGIEIDEENYYDEVLGNLVAKEVKILVIIKNSLETLPIKDYIKENYVLIKDIEAFEIYIRRT